MKDTFVSYFKSKHNVLQTWLEECICDPSAGLKKIACVSFFQCLQFSDDLENHIFESSHVYPKVLG